MAVSGIFPSPDPGSGKKRFHMRVIPYEIIPHKRFNCNKLELEDVEEYLTCKKAAKCRVVKESEESKDEEDKDVEGEAEEEPEHELAVPVNQLGSLACIAVDEDDDKQWPEKFQMTRP